VADLNVSGNGARKRPFVDAVNVGAGETRLAGRVRVAGEGRVAKFYIARRTRFSGVA
jgi:hypothetical protein